MPVASPQVCKYICKQAFDGCGCGHFALPAYRLVSFSYLQYLPESHLFPPSFLSFSIAFWPSFFFLSFLYRVPPLISTASCICLSSRKQSIFIIYHSRFSLLPFLAPPPRLFLTGWIHCLGSFRQISNTHLISLAESLSYLLSISDTHLDLDLDLDLSVNTKKRLSTSKPTHLVSPDLAQVYCLYCTVPYRRTWNMIAAFCQSTDKMVRVSAPSPKFTITPPTLYLPQHTDTGRNTMASTRSGKRRHCDSIDSDTPPPTKKYKQANSIASDASTTSTSSTATSIELDYSQIQTMPTYQPPLSIDTFLPAFKSVQYDRPAYRSISPTPPSPRSH